MITWLSNSTKKRVIKEIKEILSEHPKYRDDSNNVQNKYSFEERPARGVIVEGTSGDRVVLSADNYMGRLKSFAMLTSVDGCPNTTVEWVRENESLLSKINASGQVFPTAPGAYYFEVTGLPDEPKNLPGFVSIQPILTVFNEELIVLDYEGYGEAQLAHEHVEPKSVRIWIENRRPLVEGEDFQVDYDSGLISFLKERPPNQRITSDYRYRIAKVESLPFHKEQFDVNMIPGAVIAFGDRCQLNDRFAVVVTDERTDVADVFGGKFEMNFDLLAFSKDAEDREKLSDYIVMKILDRQNVLGFEGFELTNLTPGGENEDVFNPETDEYFYDSSISLGFRVDWFIYRPLPAVIWRAEITSKRQEESVGNMSPISEVDSVIVDPTGNSMYSIGKNYSFERMI